MLPFHVDKFFRNDIEGTALPQTAGLKLVFHAPKEGVNFLEAEIQEVLVPWKAMAGLDIKRGMFSSKVVLTMSSDTAFPKQLKPKDGVLELTIRKRDKLQLDQFEQDLAGLRSGEVDHDTEDFIDDMRDFLDRM
jgi:hypothetical protein